MEYKIKQSSEEEYVTLTITDVKTKMHISMSFNTFDEASIALKIIEKSKKIEAKEIFTGF